MISKVGVRIIIKAVALMSEGVGILRGCWCQCWYQHGSLNNLKRKMLVLANFEKRAQYQCRQKFCQCHCLGDNDIMMGTGRYLFWNRGK